MEQPRLVTDLDFEEIQNYTHNLMITFGQELGQLVDAALEHGLIVTVTNVVDPITMNKKSEVEIRMARGLYEIVDAKRLEHEAKQPRH